MTVLRSVLLEYNRTYPAMALPIMPILGIVPISSTSDQNRFGPILTKAQLRLPKLQSGKKYLLGSKIGFLPRSTESLLDL